MADEEHSLLSASGAPRWTRCYGSVALESLSPNKGSSYANEGTAAHGLAAYLLSGTPNAEITEQVLEEQRALCAVNHYAAAWIGQTIVAKGQAFTVTEDFADNVQRYVDYVESLPGIRMVETRVNYANWLSVPQHTAWGTSDTIVVHDGEQVIAINERGYLESPEFATHMGRLLATVADLKFGAGVAVYPEHNEQGMLYTGGSLNEIELITEVRDTDIIRIVIHQPRIGEGEPHEWYITVGQLKHWLRGEAATAAAHAVKLYVETTDLATGERIANVPITSLTPGEKQCRFCNAKATCPALVQHAFDTVADGFVNLDEPQNGTIPKTLSAMMPSPEQLRTIDVEKLAAYMRATDLIEPWIKAVRSAVEIELLAGRPVPGFKLVKGKMGNRKWTDEEKVGKILARHLGSGGAYKPKEIISPPAAEKALKKHFATKQDFERAWGNILTKGYITQAEGGLTVAHESEPGEPVVILPPEDAFTNLEGDDGDLSHLV